MRKLIFATLLLAVATPAFAVDLTYDEARTASELLCRAKDTIYGPMSGTGMVNCITEALYDALTFHTKMNKNTIVRTVRGYCISNMANPDNCPALIDSLRNK